MLKKTLTILASLIIVLALYLAFWPVPISPLKWQPAENQGYTGVHAVNTKLANLQTISIGNEVGPEHIAIGPDGKLYTAVAGGKILRMLPDGAAQEVFVNTGGRVLGFDFDATGNMLAADAERGLLQITPAKSITVLADKVGSSPIVYADAVVVAKSGLVYLSDASTRFAPKDWGGTFEASVLDILEQSSTGRIIEYNPATQTSRIVAKGFSFANGVALSSDEASLFVNETGKYRVWQIAVAAKELDLAQLDLAKESSQGAPPQARVLLDNLPGHPDNLMRGLPTAEGKAKIWLGFAKPRGAAVDKLAGKPWLRQLTLRLPRALWPIPPQYGHVIAFTEDGKIVADLQDPTGAYPETTGVTEIADRLYIQSLHAKSLGWVKK